MSLNIDNSVVKVAVVEYEITSVQYDDPIETYQNHLNSEDMHSLKYSEHSFKLNHIKAPSFPQI